MVVCVGQPVPEGEPALIFGGARCTITMLHNTLPLLDTTVHLHPAGERWAQPDCRKS